MAGRWMFAGIAGVLLLAGAGCSKAKTASTGPELSAQTQTKTKPVSTEPEVAAPAQAKREQVNTKLTLFVGIRPVGDPDAKFADLCETPGPVEAPAGQELLLSPITKFQIDADNSSTMSGFGDAELEQLAIDFAGTNLAVLLLDGRKKITDAGLVHLAKLTTLKELILKGTGVTDAGVAALQAKLPDCKISH